MSAVPVHHTPASHLERVEAPGAMLTRTAAKGLAVLRLATGAVFLWAFLDKTFGLGYSTPSAKAWIHGGSPTKGFLSSVDVGPLQSAFHAMAGTWWANWLFMLGMLGVGLALIAGVGLRAAAASGALIMGLMWFAEFPIAQHTATGAASGSTNPLTDYHLIYAVVLVVLAAAYAGHTWGLGRRWAKLPFVQRHRWLI
ncbi:DoxX family membrane protein [Dactylosporangium siamense]|uniref:Membrane protein n=1 Tax=Dactylosporangium siamense TaxID=685454 RepID=A0A919PM23_9ACTN|nr:DoxX family membrane protein [Dactylosporangium siamense]GIG45711.1 membrane protein [Dactylosporangium siamense]